jgi:hypothetical protein
MKIVKGGYYRLKSGSIAYVISRSSSHVSKSRVRVKFYSKSGEETCLYGSYKLHSFQKKIVERVKPKGNDPISVWIHKNQDLITYWNNREMYLEKA